MPRRRRGPLTLRHLPGGADARVAFAVGRAAGNAVARNRIRRRLRAALVELDRAHELEPGAYLVGAGAPAMTMPYGELLAELRALVAVDGTTR